MGIQNEVWISDIQKVLFQSSLKFLETATSHDGYVSYKTVNLPQAGGGIGVTKNYSGSYPMAVSQRVDTIKSYTCDEYGTDVMIVTYTEELQTSYDKRASIIKQQTDALGQVIGSEVLKAWSLDTVTGDTNCVFTSGTASTNFNQGGQTGNRKAPLATDILKLKNILDNQYVSEGDRYLMLPSAMFNALLTDPVVNSAINFFGFSANMAVLPEAKLPMIGGFKVMERPTVAAYSATTTGGTATALTLTGTTGVYTLAATDNVAGIAYSKDCVSKAFGGVQVWQGIENDPVFNGGQSLKANVILGATKLRTDLKGVAMLIQGV